MSSRLPARGPAITSRVMLHSFDVDCGELVPGQPAGRLIIDLPHGHAHWQRA